MTWALSENLFTSGAGAVATALESDATHPAGYTIDGKNDTWWQSSRWVKNDNRVNFNPLSPSTAHPITFLNLQGTDLYKVFPDQPRTYSGYYATGSIGGGVIYDFGVDQLGGALDRVKAHINGVTIKTGNVRQIVVDVADDASGPWVQIGDVTRPLNESSPVAYSITCTHAGYSRYVRIRVLSTMDGGQNFQLYYVLLPGLRYQAVKVSTPQYHAMSQFVAAFRDYPTAAFIEAKKRDNTWVEVASMTISGPNPRVVVDASTIVEANEWRLVVTSVSNDLSADPYAYVVAFEGRKLIYTGPPSPIIAAGIDPAHTGMSTYMGRPVQDQYNVTVSSAGAYYPARRLTDNHASMVWRPEDGVSSATITLTAKNGVAQGIQGVALLRHGLDYEHGGKASVKINGGTELAMCFGPFAAWVNIPTVMAGSVEIKIEGVTTGVGEVFLWSVGLFPATNYLYGSSVGADMILRTYSSDTMQYQRTLATRRQWVRNYNCVPWDMVAMLMDLQHGRYILFSPNGYTDGLFYGMMTLSAATEIAPDQYDVTVTVDEIPLVVPER